MTEAEYERAGSGTCEDVIKDFKNYLKEGERIDDLQRDGLMIIQNPSGFCFGVDAVLLSDFAAGYQADSIADLGSGSGIIPILLSAKTKASKIVGLEIQEDAVDMSGRSIVMNGLQDRVSVIKGDIKEASGILGRDAFDMITSNPPYMRGQKGLLNPHEPKAIARHEIKMSFEDLIREASLMLKDKGRFCMVHRPLRLPEFFETLRKYKLEPKRMRMVHPDLDSEANMVLIEARKGGGPELRTLPPIILSINHV